MNHSERERFMAHGLFHDLNQYSEKVVLHKTHARNRHSWYLMRLFVLFCSRCLRRHGIQLKFWIQQRLVAVKRINCPNDISLELVISAITPKLLIAILKTEATHLILHCAKKLLTTHRTPRSDCLCI